MMNKTAEKKAAKSKTDLKIIIQKENHLDADKTAEAINKTQDAKLVIIHSSLNDDKKLEQYIKNLNKKIKTPMIGLKVSGTYTEGNYYENTVVIGILCGDMEVAVHHEKINYENPEDTAEGIKQKIKKAGEVDALLVYTATYMYKVITSEHILRRVNEAKKNLQIWGANSTPHPKVFSNEGIFEEHIVYAIVKNLEYNLFMDSGLNFKNDSREYTVTRSDDYFVYRIDGENAVSKYCGLLKARPWFIDMFMRNVTHPRVAEYCEILVKANENLRKGVIKSAIEILGVKNKKGQVEVMYVHDLNEEESKFRPYSYKPEGTKLEWISLTEESILEVYNEMVKSMKKSKCVIGHSCGFRPFLYKFNYDEAKERIKMSQPYLISYVYGELASLPPYEKNDNIYHTCIVNA